MSIPSCAPHRLGCAVDLGLCLPIEQLADGKEPRVTYFAAIFDGAVSIPIQVSGKSVIG
jgi:hypothetical protein